MPEKNTSDRERVVEVIRKELRENGTQLKQILLFGSRARETARTDSDWDFIIIIENELTPPERISLASKIRYRLATELIDADIIVKLAKDYDMQKGNVGYLSYYADREGVAI